MRLVHRIGFAAQRKVGSRTESRSGHLLRPAAHVANDPFRKWTVHRGGRENTELIFAACDEKSQPPRPEADEHAFTQARLVSVQVLRRMVVRRRSRIFRGSRSAFTIRVRTIGNDRDHPGQIRLDQCFLERRAGRTKRTGSGWRPGWISCPATLAGESPHARI